MSTCDHPPPATFAGAVHGAELVDLAAILERDVHLATWSRAGDPRITGLLERPEFRLLRPSRTVVRSSDPALAQRITELIPDAAAASDPDGAAALAADIHLLSRAFSDLVAADELMISLEEPDEASCPRFHVDWIGIRMLVTYRGPGTEWLPDEHVDRQRLGRPGMGLPDDENGVMRPGAEPVRLPTFAVLLLKGEAWPNASGFGVVHRSPDPGGAPRTLLRVDMLTQLPIDPATASVVESPTRESEE